MSPPPDRRQHGEWPAPTATAGNGPHTLPRGGSIGLPPQSGRVVVCTQGLLMIRQQGGIDDHLLRAGQCWHADPDAAVAVQALVDAQFRVDPG